MNRLYTFVLILFVSLTTYAQTIFYDDFESYTGGNIPTCEIWSTWNGIYNDGSGILVVDDIAIDNQSGYIGPGSVQDVLLKLYNQNGGDYTLKWEMYITGGSTGYFNIQGMTEIDPVTGCIEAGNGNAGIFNSSNLYFNNAGAAPGVFEDQTTGETGTYPEDAWFEVSIYFDLISGNPTYTISIQGNVVNAAPVPFQTDNILGAIDFFSIDANNNIWIDNVHYLAGIGTIGFDDTNASPLIQVAPNPVTYALQIQTREPVNKVDVYDVMGRLILSEIPNKISPKIDLSRLNSGAYFVKVTVGDASKTVKIIK